MDTATLKRTEGLEPVPEQALEQLLRIATPGPELAAGDVLYDEGDPYRGRVYLVDAGVFELTRTGRAPRQAPAGYFMGLSSYFSDSPFTARATALEQSRVMLLDAAALRDLERDQPALAAAFDRFIRASLEQRRVDTGDPAAAVNVPVASVMSSPLRTCPVDTSQADAVALMDAAGVGSVLLEDGGGDRVVTYASLARRMALPDTRPTADPVRDAALPVLRVDAQDPLWKAQDLQLREGAKYLLVERDGAAVGMLSQTDMVRALQSRDTPMAPVRDARDMAALRAVYDAMVSTAAGLLQSNRLARVAVRSLSEAHLAVQRRCVELTLEEMLVHGDGTPPAPFALIIMGSGGRREMLLDPDQDNGMILDDGVEGDAGAGGWFERFAGRLNVNLDACGYVLCPGDIMARNPMYRKSLAAWKAQIARLCRRPTEKAARWSSIVFDFDTQYGDAALTRQIRRHVNRELGEHPRLLNLMVDDDARGRAPLNWFNQLVATGERGGRDTVDVKRNGLRMVANAARILALKHGVTAGNTSERISALARAGVMGRDLEATVLDAYDELLAILLSHQIRQRRAGQVPDKAVAPDDLMPRERESLRISMRAVKRFQEFLQDEVGGERL